MMKATFKNVLSFEFWQKFGKALMVVIAVMPAAGLMISIGKSLVMINPNFSPLVITGGVLEQIGWGVIVNLHILFALAIGGSWAKERAGGAFAAGLAFILINRITGTIFGVSGDMLKIQMLWFQHYWVGQSKFLITLSVLWKLQHLTWVFS